MGTYLITESKLNKADNNLFDIQTVPTLYGKDINFGANGGVNRIIGLDKLKQQVVKSVLVRKNTYSNVPKFGTSFINKNKDSVSIIADIKESLATYASLQQNQVPNTISIIVGRNVYKNIDITNPNGWKKINKHIITSNTFVDTDVTVGTTYYYATTFVYKDVVNKTNETNIKTYQSITVPINTTQDAKVNYEFVAIPKNNKVSLFWNLPINLSIEEQLRSIVDITATPFAGDPRRLGVNIKVTNRNLTQAQITLLRQRD